MILSPGTKAPPFSLQATSDKHVTLADFKGKPLILVFYPADWSPVCSSQLALYNELLPEFSKFNAEILGVSVDNTWSHMAFAEQSNLHIPLLSDFEPKGKIAQEYGVYNQQNGMAERALFVIDKDGVIRWSYVSPMKVNPGADGILNALESL